MGLQLSSLLSPIIDIVPVAPGPPSQRLRSDMPVIPVALFSRCYQLLLVLAIASTASAYYIDDANSTIVYSATAGGGWLWMNLTGLAYPRAQNGSANVTLDHNRFRNQTAYVPIMIRQPGCTDSGFQELYVLITYWMYRFYHVDNYIPQSQSAGRKNNAKFKSHLLVCALPTRWELPINLISGTGITLYGVVWGDTYTNFTMAIDGQPAEVSTRSPPPEITSPAIYNITLYDLQSLPYHFHQLTMTLTNSSSSDHRSLLLLDYVYVNETVPVQHTTKSQSALSYDFEWSRITQNSGIAAPPE
jgi:hypothetical protein